MSFSICEPYQLFETWLPWPTISRVTAIAFVHTPDGFVVGAEGRQINSVTNTIQSDTAQKIFPFESETIRVAYAWTGTTQVDALDQTCIYDLNESTERLLRAADLLGRTSWADFVARFCDGLRVVLPPCIEAAPREIAKIALIGFFNRVPCKAIIKIRYPRSLLVFDLQIQIPAQYQKQIFTGAERVYDPYKSQQPQNIVEAIRFVRDYILDCIESEEADCKGMGGHLHIATVTSEAFSWVVPPRHSQGGKAGGTAFGFDL
jgi:hypothetical protein